MKCQRCESQREAEFRVVSDVMNIKVCAVCAAEARRLGTSLQVLEIDNGKSEAASNAAARVFRAVMVG